MTRPGFESRFPGTLAITQTARPMDRLANQQQEVGVEIDWPISDD